MLRRMVFSAVLVLFAFSFYAQNSVEKIDQLIPALQYDDDFMTYSRLEMLDGFNVLKRVSVLKKYSKNDKIYAVEKVKLSGNKVKEKVTYFYLNDTPVAISVENDGQTIVYYLNNGGVFAMKQFANTLYKPYGGQKTLNLADVKVSDKVKKPSKKIMDQAGYILDQLKQVNQKILNYRF